MLEPFDCYSFREGLEDPLDDLGMVQQQLEQLSVIGRCEYQKTCTLLVQLFDQAARAYQELMATPNAQQLDITIQEGKYLQLRFSENCEFRVTVITNIVAHLRNSIDKLA